MKGSQCSAATVLPVVNLDLPFGVALGRGSVRVLITLRSPCHTIQSRIELLGTISDASLGVSNLEYQRVAGSEESETCVARDCRRG